MKTDYSPQSNRAKFVHLIWRNLPRLLLFTLIILSVLGYYSVKNKGKRIADEKAQVVAEQKQPVNVVVLETHPILIQDRINLPGSIEAWEQLELMAKVGGTVKEVLVTEGDRVKKGTIIAKIEEDDFSIALQSAEAAWTLAQAERRRVKAMHAKGIAPQAEMERVQSQYLTAQASLNSAKLNLSRCVIKTPITGIIRRLDATPGLLLSVADPVAEILQIDRVKAVVGIPESDVAAVRKLNEINLSIQALDDRQIVGKKHFLSPAPESNAHVYRLELAIANDDFSIFPGMFVRAAIVKTENAAALAIPLYSIITRNDEQFIYIEKDGIAKKQMVQQGIMDGWMVEITAGLSAGDRVVIEGHRNIEDQQQVRVIRSLSSLDTL